MNTGANCGRDFKRGQAILTSTVLIHFGVTAVHGFAHARASITMSLASRTFVFAVILIGPFLGLIVQLLGWPRAGAWAIAAMMASALVFGLVNHFLIPGPDHVSHVAQPWRLLFGATAALLVPTEAIGSALAVWIAVNNRRNW
jgi:hypothetical protein